MRKVKVGSELDIKLEVAPDKSPSVIDAQSRSFLTRVLVCAGLISLTGAGLYGACLNDFSYLNVVWAAVGPIFGAVVGHYFRGEPN